MPRPLAAPSPNSLFPVLCLRNVFLHVARVKPVHSGRRAQEVPSPEVAAVRALIFLTARLQTLQPLNLLANSAVSRLPHIYFFVPKRDQAHPGSAHLHLIPSVTQHIRQRISPFLRSVTRHIRAAHISISSQA